MINKYFKIIKDEHEMKNNFKLAVKVALGVMMIFALFMIALWILKFLFMLLVVAVAFGLLYFLTKIVIRTIRKYI